MSRPASWPVAPLLILSRDVPVDVQERAHTGASSCIVTEMNECALHASLMDGRSSWMDVLRCAFETGLEGCLECVSLVAFVYYSGRQREICSKTERQKLRRDNQSIDLAVERRKEGRHGWV